MSDETRDYEHDYKCLAGDAWALCDDRCGNDCNGCPVVLSRVCDQIGRREEEERNQREGKEEDGAQNLDYERSR